MPLLLSPNEDSGQVYKAFDANLPHLPNVMSLTSTETYVVVSYSTFSSTLSGPKFTPLVVDDQPLYYDSSLLHEDDGPVVEMSFVEVDEDEIDW